MRNYFKYSLPTFLLLIILQLSGSVSSFAQFGNEWLVPGQMYFKIPVGQTGMYAVSFNQLQTSGIPIKSSVAPEELQLFHRGVEQAILVKNDSMFFYGKRNDGTLDSLLYQPSGSQPGKFYNLYSDTTYYFLTWSTGKLGKRMSPLTIATNSNSEQYHFQEDLQFKIKGYTLGYRYSQETWMSYYDKGEGWVGEWFGVGGSKTYNFNLSNVYTSSGEQPKVRIQVTGHLIAAPFEYTTKNHAVEIGIQSGSLSEYVISVPEFEFMNSKTFEASFPAAYLINGNMNITIRNKGNGYPSVISTDYVQLTYPQTYSMNNLVSKLFTIPTNFTTSSISISNFYPGSFLFDITNTNDIKLVSPQVNNTLVEIMVLGGSKIFAVSPTAYLTTTHIRNVPMTMYDNKTSADFIIISHYKLMSGAREYAKFKATAEGGGHDTILAEVNNIYDQFSYGEKSPIAIKRFLSYLYKVGSPKSIFIIGKGLIPNYNQTGLYDRGDFYRENPNYYINNSDASIQREDFVPPFGVPGSDWMYVMGLDGGNPNIPTLPIGRFAAKKNSEVLDYLDKVKLHVKTPNELWRKNLLHLSGGKYDFEKTSFLNFVNELKGIVEDTIYGGKVIKTITKEGSNSIDPTLISSISEIVNSGISMMTFYGHTTPDFTEIDFGYPSMDFYGYNNKGKYPLLLTNGCYSGEIFEWSSFAEDWVVTKDRGAIASIGHTNIGYTGELERYTRAFYKAAFDTRDMIGKPVGEVQLRTIQNYSKFGLHEEALATIQQMTLHGDPSIRIYMPSAPDLFIDDSKVSIHSFDNRVVTALTDSFAIKLTVENLGLNLGDSVQVSVKRTINGQIISYGPVTYHPINYRDTLLFIIKSPDVSTFGENIFEIFIDPNDSIKELNEANNTAILKYFMPVSSVTALYPTEFSIVSSNPVTLIGQSTNLLSEEKAYYVEIDTSYLYNSFYKRDTIINATSLIKWNNLNLPYLKDSTVYYWRIRYNDIAAGATDTLWGESTFIYIKGSPDGWSQSEFPQFFKDQTSQIKRNVPKRSWEFTNNFTQIDAITSGVSNITEHPDVVLNPSMETVISVYGVVYTFQDNCYPDAMLAVAFDRATGKPYTKDGLKCGVYGKTESVNAFNVLSDMGHQQNLIDYINSIPNGDAVLLVSTGQANFSSWGQTKLNEKIRDSFGADSVMKLTDGRPYILLARKGGKKPLKEITVLDSKSSLISLKDTLVSTNSSGYITSTLIGPATTWGKFYHDVTTKEALGIDDDSLMIIGVDISGRNVDTLAISQKDSLDLTTVGGLSNYPYIRLLAKVGDSINLTPPHLRKWQVIYSGVPEGTMNTGVYGLKEYNAVTKLEGDSIKVCYAFENISNFPFKDSLYVRYTITNSSTGPKSELVKLVPLTKDSILTFCRTISTRGLGGDNIFQAYVNPQLQKEQYFNNNILEMTFTVIKDKTHPVLDVVFDGSHIMNGDIVSPNPQITITLNDENPYLIRNSTDGIEIYLQKPGQSVPEKVNTSEYLGKQVGVNGKNVYQIEFKPNSLPDGIYTLIVRANDVAGNASGTQDYRVQFEVINESTISHFYPYPNPFSTNTRFVFTLTGNEIPQDMIIQIMTVTGKVIREITKAEIGPIKIGNNKTDYAWDGTDEFGDKLANGVYLYRVLIKNDDDFKRRKTAGDKAFHKDWGKLYILR